MAPTPGRSIMAGMLAFVLATISLGATHAATPVASPVAFASPASQFTPLIPAVHSLPQWFRGSDGQVHLAYELMLTNALPVPVTVERVETRDADRGTLIASLSGSSLEAATSLLATGTVPTTTIDPSSIAVVWFDIALPDPSAVPANLVHTVTMRVPPGLPIPETITFTGASTVVDQRAPLVIGAPLEGANWAAVGSCCDGPHRRAMQPIDGQEYLAQRYAIDFNLLDSKNRITVGDPTLNASTAGFGQPVIAVAEATVVQAENDLPDQTPGSPPTGVTLETADGNYVILDLGDGYYAFYAHLRQGTVTVKAGDTVKRGEILGELGNSGSSDGAHLHFQVMDAPSALKANGLPYAFETYAVTGQLPPLADIAALYEQQQPLPVDTSTASSQHGTLPLGGNVMTFPTPEPGA